MPTSRVTSTFCRLFLGIVLISPVCHSQSTLIFASNYDAVLIVDGDRSQIRSRVEVRNGSSFPVEFQTHRLQIEVSSTSQGEYSVGLQILEKSNDAWFELNTQPITFDGTFGIPLEYEWSGVDVQLNLALVFSQARPYSPDPCAYDHDAMMALDENTFDQDPDNGWRKVARGSGCKLAAANLIRDYLKANDIRKPIILWHEGQMRAMVGQTERAIVLFAQTRRPDGETDRIGWNHYVDATIAFLRKDRVALEVAGAALRQTQKPEAFNPVDVNGNPVDMIWPPNLNVVDGLIECFEKSYDDAYNSCSKPFSRGDSPKSE